MLDTHNKYITFGKHKGERWTRLPVGYLRWLANEGEGDGKLMAEAELARRGTTLKWEVELSGHSLDRASQITDEWKSQGVYSWLMDLAGIAATMTEKAEGDEKIEYGGYKLVFVHGNHYPILKTIMK